MALELTGKVLQLLPEQTGTGKNGAWVKQDFIVETQEQFPKKVCFSAWGDKVATIKGLGAGTTVKVQFNVESREFNGRWYTDLRPWKIDAIGASGASPSEAPLPNEEYFGNAGNEIGAGDLPF
jgi:hypothetical protein